MDVGEINKSTYELTVKNPNKKEITYKENTSDILKEIEILNEKTSEVLRKLKDYL